MMTFVRPLLAAWAAACLAVACGGGAADTSAGAPVTLVATEAPSQVRIEGCVLDVTDRPLALPVHATAADGRLVASAMTDNAGVFRMHVPAREPIRLAAATPGAQALTVLTGNSDLTVVACLRPALA